MATITTSTPPPAITPMELFRSDVLEKLRESSPGMDEQRGVLDLSMIERLWEGQSKEVKALYAQRCVIQQSTVVHNASVTSTPNNASSPCYYDPSSPLPIVETPRPPSRATQASSTPASTYSYTMSTPSSCSSPIDPSPAKRRRNDSVRPGPVVEADPKPLRKRRKVVKDPDEPKRPLNPYLLFRKDARPQVLKDHPGIRPQEAAKLLGQMWRELGSREKGAYSEKAEGLRNEYHEQKARYKYKQMERNALAASTPLSASPPHLPQSSPIPSVPHSRRTDGYESDGYASFDEDEDADEEDSYDAASRGSGTPSIYRAPSTRPMARVGTIWVRFGSDPDPIKLDFPIDGSKDVHDLKEAAMCKCKPGDLRLGGGTGSVTAFIGAKRLEAFRPVDAALLQGVSAVNPLALVPNSGVGNGGTGGGSDGISTLKTDVEGLKTKMAEMVGYLEGRVGRLEGDFRDALRKVDGVKHTLGEIRTELLMYIRHTGAANIGHGMGQPLQMLEHSQNLTSILDKLGGFGHSIDDHARNLHDHAEQLQQLQNSLRGGPLPMGSAEQGMQGMEAGQSR
ncbi:hypothetical protein HK104_010587 [Borealophlyctis nickersoniae]|nr:hypothetical protein HK104_010587 [Borealophlyctis nickersoniae]